MSEEQNYNSYIKLREALKIRCEKETFDEVLDVLKLGYIYVGDTYNTDFFEYNCSKFNLDYSELPTYDHEWTNCECGVNIKHKFFVYNQEKKDLIIVGSVCFPNLDLDKTCICGKKISIKSKGCRKCRKDTLNIKPAEFFARKKIAENMKTIKKDNEKWEKDMIKNARKVHKIFIDYDDVEETDLYYNYGILSKIPPSFQQIIRFDNSNIKKHPKIFEELDIDYFKMEKLLVSVGA